MSNYIRTCGLDMALLNNYIKSIAFSILGPIIFIVVSGDLISGICFSMSIIAMTSGYTFSIAEKNEMSRLYGILPVKKSELVIGRYFCMILIGLAALFFSLTAQTIIVSIMGKEVTANKILVSAVLGFLSFLIYTSFQIPGYYKFGSIKGKIFIYIPIVGFLGIIQISKMLLPGVGAMMSSPLLLFTGMAALTLLILAGSVLMSVKILKSKEL